MFKLSDSEIYDIECKKKCYLDSRAASIEALKIVQNKRKWVCDEAIIAISKILNVSANDIEGVATFYSHIFRKPVGRNIIYLCDSSVCFINNFYLIQEKIENFLKIKFGETTTDFRYTFLPTCCLGACDKGPVMLVNKCLHTKLKKKNIVTLLENYK